MKKNILLFASFVSLLNIVQASANNYVWIHGDKNDDNCWKIYDNSYTQGVGTRVKYVFSSNGKTTSENIWNNYNLNSRSDNILIGYSIGGLIAREIEFNHPSNVKGIITLGTPQSGVVTKEGVSVVEDIYAEFRARLNNAIQQTALTTFPIVGNVVMDIVFRNSEKDYINNLPYYEDNSNTGYNYTVLEKDFLQNSAYMKAIENRTVNTPILCLAAEEDRWQLGRMLYCSKGITDLQTNSLINANGTYDLAGYNQLNLMTNACLGMGIVHTVAATGSTVLAFFYPPAAISAATNTLAAIAWYDANSYINNKLDYNHAIYLGAYHTDRIDTWHKILFVKWMTSEYVKVPEGHDGLASVKSQYLATNKGAKVIIPAASIKNVNHMEEFNHKNTRTEFEKALVLGGYGETFYRGFK